MKTILRLLKIYNFSDFARYNKHMEIQRDGDTPVNDSWTMKIFSEMCCDGCMCKSSDDHKKEDQAK
jgi:hypothetical protein